MQRIETDSQYEQVMAQIEVFLQKATHNGGFSALTEQEANELEALSLLANDYEDRMPDMMIRLEKPNNLPDMIRLKMFEKKLKQKDLAKLLEISEGVLSEILRAKRKINLTIAQKLHSILQIDPAFILQVA